MFSQADAKALRESLPDLDFLGPGNGASEEESELLTKYVAHYGLTFPDHAPLHRLGKFTIPSAQATSAKCTSEKIVEQTHYEIVCQYFRLPIEQEKGTAFLLHGYFDHVGIFVHLIRHCLSLGYSVVIFDQPGHGLSSGSTASIESFACYVDALTACLERADQQGLAGPWQLIGQSTGCSVIMDGLQRNVSPLLRRMDRFVLLAPLLRPHRWAQLHLPFVILRHVLKRIPRSFAENSHDQEFLDFLAQHDDLQSRSVAVDWLQAMSDFQKRFAAAAPENEELHIIQGSDDTTVDWKYNLPNIVEKFPKAKTYMVADARHQLVNESAEYRGRVFSLIGEILRARTTLDSESCR